LRHGVVNNQLMAFCHSPLPGGTAGKVCAAL